MTHATSTPTSSHSPFPPVAGEHAVTTLNDGTPVLIRPLRPEDREREQAFIRRLSPESRRCRFLGEMREASSPLLDSLMDTDGVTRVAYVALAHDNGELREVGISRYASASDRTRCECAVTVADDWRHRGLAVALMHHLIDTARRNGFQTMYSIDLAENHDMEELARHLGFTRVPDSSDATLVMHTLQLSTTH
ncbi:N-acetyltransferase family protein [Luteibacter sp. CQ10]|uniref:N-acetyltransferase family protein n=1 Tax=Luteibacter sp. CQ10 TaxID=2805821 RepID=UPI0034A2B975